MKKRQQEKNFLWLFNMARREGKSLAAAKVAASAALLGAAAVVLLVSR